MDQMIINIADRVHRALGSGRSESVYHRAMEIALRDHNVSYQSEVPILIKYMDRVVGYERADLIVSESYVIELKAINNLKPDDTKQLQRYLKDLNLNSGLLINFGPVLEVKHIIENK